PVHYLRGQLLFEWFLTLVCSDSILSVTTLVNTSNKGPSGKKKGRSKKAHVLAASVEQATQNFLEKGDQIAKESQDLKEELVAAVDDVRKQGMWENVDSFYSFLPRLGLNV
uniref:Uncharacterized protein n=1 Tax=Serinus canaria TaxID=9135 RepID=A0A8C9MEF9_SERCA